MKKLILFLILLGSMSSVNAQFINYGIKGGLNYNSNGDLRTLQGFQDDLKIRSDRETGYHFGVFSEIKLPLWIYIRPELLYTHTKSNYNKNEYDSNLTINKFDAPILVGMKILHFGRLFAGPVFTYLFNTDLDNTDLYDNVKNISSDDFSVGGQIGLGVELGKLGADIRWETGFTDTESRFIGEHTNGYVGSDDNATIKVDTRPQQFILSVYYSFK